MNKKTPQNKNDLHAFNTLKDGLLQYPKSQEFHTQTISMMSREINPADPDPFKKEKIGRQILAVRQKYDTHTHIFNLSELHGEFHDIHEKFINIDVDKLIEFVGHEGRYQYTIIAIASLLAIMMSMILYSPSFILAEPNFLCQDSEAGKLSPCNESEFCDANWLGYQKNPLDYQNQIIWHYGSWVQEYTLICDFRKSRNTYKQTIMFISAIMPFVAA
jgi:hypothetical protein